MSTDFFILLKSELSVALILFILLILKVWDGIKENSTYLHIANFLLLLNFVVGILPIPEGTLFSGMFHTNSLLVFEKSILNLGTLLISMFAYDWLKTHKHVPEFFILLLSTLLGMFFMISSGNFLMFYLGLELASIPLAALANFDLEKIKSSEAAVKMILLSAFSSCIMLFGISLLYGSTGTLTFSELPPLIAAGNLQLLSLIFVFVGFAFKLSSVPFHLWTADVYEGSPVAVTAYLSVISKAAIVFVFISVLGPLFLNFPNTWYNILFLSIVLTITVGNLFAIRQDNIKRFLAFSSIAQAGYILLGLSSGNQMGTTSTIYFLLVYVFSNLGAFGVISIVSVHADKENITDYKGFYKTNPFLSWILAISLFSLAGVPPTAGFFGKMFLVTAGASHGNFLLISIAALNMVVSLYYYLRVVKAMFVDYNASPIPKLSGSNSARFGLLICISGVIVIGFASCIYDYINGLIF
ncbi:MAG: NADH-quinone oxidoreductase subunit N [Bacteroidetes bacterium]|nr:NADH-quinone oxidoreductase subunit N [Bacteroidota bacterium]